MEFVGDEVAPEQVILRAYSFHTLLVFRKREVTVTRLMNFLTLFL
jgi:hypothetical protein